MSRPRVILCLATRGKDLSSIMFQWLVKLCVAEKYDVSYCISECNVSARITMLQTWKQLYDSNMEWDYYLFLDSDIQPGPDTLEKLIAADKDVVTTPVWFYDKYKDDFHIGLHYDAKEFGNDRLYVPKNVGVERIIAAHFACTLVKRRVLEVFKEAKESCVEWSPLIDDFYREKHNDNIFYAKCEKLGIEAYVNWDVKDVVHWQSAGLSTNAFTKFIKHLKIGEE